MGNKTSSQIKIGAIISYFAIFASTVLSLFYTPWMKNQIGDANYGLYTLVSTLIAIFLMDFGLGTAATRFLSKFRAENDVQKINDTVGYIFKLYLIIDALILVTFTVLYFLIDNIYVGLTVEERSVFKTIFLIFGTYSVFAFPFAPLSGILNAYEKFIQLKLCDLFQKLFSVALIVVVLLLQYGVIALVLMNAVAGIVTILIKLLIIGKGRLIKPNFKVKNMGLLKSIFGFSIWATVLALAERLIFNIAPSILGITSNSMEIALFSPVAQLEGYFYSFAFAINGLFMPTIARLDEEHDEAKISDLMKKVGKFQIIILGLIYSGIVVVGSEFLLLWMGEKYVISAYCTMLILTPSILLYPQQIANTLMSIRNKIKYQSISALVAGVINVALSFALTPKYGVWGAAISICVAFIVKLIMLNLFYKKILGLRLKSFYINVYLRFAVVIIVSVLISYFSVGFITVTGWWGLFIKVVICTFVYMIVVILALSKEEKSNVITGIKKKFGKKNENSDN